MCFQDKHMQMRRKGKLQRRPAILNLSSDRTYSRSISATPTKRLTLGTRGLILSQSIPVRVSQTERTV